MYGTRGEFVCDDIGNFASYGLAKSDIIVAIGLLHHLDDDLAARTLRAMASALKPEGRLVGILLAAMATRAPRWSVNVELQAGPVGGVDIVHLVELLGRAT